MRKLIQFERIARGVCFASWTLLAAALIYYVLVPLRSTTLATRTMLHDVGDVSREVKAQIAPTAKSVGIILRGAAVITDETAKASTAQKHYWGSLETQTSGLIGDTRLTVAKYGRLADVVTLPLPDTFQRVNTSLDSLNNTLLTTNSQMGKVGPLFDQATGLVTDARAGLDNPELAEARRNAGRIVASWAGMSEDMQKKLHRSLNPAHPSGVNLVLDGVRVAGPLGELIYDLTNTFRR